MASGRSPFGDQNDFGKMEKNALPAKYCAQSKRGVTNQMAQSAQRVAAFSWQIIAASGLCSKACRVGSSSTNCGNREWYRISKNWIFLTSLRSRRLDDRIRELCAHAVAADNSPHMKSILSELQSAIHQYTQRLRARAAAILTGRNLAPDRRKTYRDRRKAA